VQISPLEIKKYDVFGFQLYFMWIILIKYARTIAFGVEHAHGDEDGQRDQHGVEAQVIQDAHDILCTKYCKM
jgi:hypothetical protein